MCVFYNKYQSRIFKVWNSAFNPGAIEAAKMLPSALYGFANDSSISSSQQSSASSPAPVPVCWESGRIQHSTPLSTISSGSNSDSNYSSSGLTTLSASVCSSGGSSLSSVSPIVSPWTPRSVSCSTPTLNSLVRAGLIPPHLADLLTTPPATKQPTKHITGARDLTANEYYQWLQEEE